MKQRLLLILGVMALALATTGCAISDYDGWGKHQTQAEAKLFGTEISFILGDPNLDGTYAYTVKYDNRGGGRDANMKIISYRNPVPESFSRDGQIDRDGDDVQGSTGIQGGKFLPEWVAIDPAPDCQFQANIVQDHSHGAGPLATLCDTVEEEVDKDLDLQADFASTGDLLSKIWSGAVTGGFTAEMNGVTLGGTTYPLSQVVTVNARANGTRPTRVSLNLTTPGGRELLQTILDHTADGVPVSVGFRFSGGMTLDLPSRIKVVFNRQALSNLL